MPAEGRRPGSRSSISRWLPGGSLYAKLLLLSLLLVVVPGAVFAWIAVDDARRALEHAVGRQLAEVAQDIAERVQGEVDRIESTLRSASLRARMLEVRNGDAGEQASRLLVSLQGGDAAIGALFAADRKGTVVAAGDRALLGTSVSSRPWWTAALRGHSVTSVSSGGDAIEMVAPIVQPGGPGTVVGALVAVLPWERMEGVLQHQQHDLAALGLDVSLLVLDDGGRVLGGGWWEEPSELSGKDLDELGWRAPELARASARASYLRDEAAGALVGYAPIATPRDGYTALAVQPLAEALAPVQTLRLRLLAVLVGVLLLGLLLASWLAERLSRPIRELTEATRELARTGVPKAPVVVRSRDEIGDLARAFNRMGDDLTRARDDLLAAAKFAFVGELAAGMTHEIRTPLGILRSSAQILGRRLPGDERSAELVEMIVSEVDRLDRVVAGLLELARPREPVVEPVSLASVLGRALDFLSSQADEQGVCLRRDLSAVIPPARCDPEQIHQVALNLVVNAMQNLPRGGTVEVRTFARGDLVGFEVSDDGPGIPPDLQEKIFTPFFTRRPGGTGLGLVIVQRIVQSHRGTVSLESEVGRGTTFRIELPAAQEKP